MMVLGFFSDGFLYLVAQVINAKNFARNQSKLVLLLVIPSVVTKNDRRDELFKEFWYQIKA